MEKKVILLLALFLFGCTENRQYNYTPVAQSEQGPRAISTVQAVYSEEDAKLCAKASVDMENEKGKTFSCLNGVVKKLTDKTSVADEVITAAYFSCSNEISSLSKTAYRTTHCNMAKETSKSLLYFDNRLPYDDAKYEGRVKQALYPKLVNDVLTRKRLIK
ncbi:hypothetical protein [Citrobacter amalonaticus]|uniref:hypothetical protein n=1 Tax=Citrobacter amalonaticus TaxID=35703 RepID=UPI0006226CB5|nr:hypothetical protein [Citrobacter amalonaticus]KKF68282.1 hypothetical protein XU19_17905 [Vibrio parahaemolyticus]KKY40116.1 hypothetical protein AAY51_23060 [Vibrio parahaemolyticus]KOP96999.1 hypothetical protein AL012_06620 [Citrobacter amalonaticus]KOP98427.1 hypothetical protein ALC61_09985 [Citrobacter amalonaticus]